MIHRSVETKWIVRGWRFAVLLALLSILNMQATNAQCTGEEVRYHFGNFSVGDLAADITTNAYWDNHTKYSTVLYSKQASLRFRLLLLCLRKNLEHDLSGHANLFFDVRENGSVDYVSISRESPCGGHYVTKCDDHSLTPVTYFFRDGGLVNAMVKNPSFADDSSACSIVKNFKFPPPPEQLGFGARIYQSRKHTLEQSKTIFVHDNCSYP